ncbi:hypothetical protein FB470_005425 [Amycolatopsis thermophila]|uniref:Uncharacterized protein n=1 Tax=Amycolatopsis thermophila TaxID=206084 RepID=A0ABU0F1N3_9PSEU|nr:hypothetical protein [Amycolatopsis thermophila]
MAVPAVAMRRRRLVPRIGPVPRSLGIGGIFPAVGVGE